MSPSTGVAGALVTSSTACPAGLALRSAAGLALPGPGVGVGVGVISGKGPATSFFRLRTDSRVIISRKATTRATSPSTGVRGALVKTSTARPAGLTLRSATGLALPGPGLGVGAGVISGKSPAAFPAPTTVVLTFRFGIGPGMAAEWMMPRGLTAFPGPMSELVALFGFGRGPRSGTLADGLGDGELVVPALAVAEPEPVELAMGVGLEDAEDVGLAVGVGDVEGSELALGVGAGDVEGAGLALVVGAGVDGDGLGVPEALGSGLVLTAAGEGEGEEATALANAGSCEPAGDSPETRKPPVTRPATTTRRHATDM